MRRRTGADAVRAWRRALDGRDVGPLTARLDDTSILHAPGFSGLGGDYQGCEAIVGPLERMTAATDGTLRFEVHHSSTSPSGALRIDGRLSGTREGRLFSATVSVDTTLADQVLRSITLGCADRAAWDALWGRAPR